MRDTKLIIIAGMSGCGKSTTAQQLAKQYHRNNVPYIWLHEEIKDHPIREGEFSIGSIHNVDDMDLNVVDMYKRWERLVDEIDKSNSVYIMEGCLYQNIIRYFFSCNYPLKKITKFYDTIMEILYKVKPTIVFLYRTDIKASFEEAFQVRGDRWKNLILEPEEEGYFTKHPYIGEESIYAMWEDYQTISHQMFERFHGNKIKRDTSNHLWGDHIKQITEYLGLEYKNEDKNFKLENPKDYCGTYQVTINDKNYQIQIKYEHDELYCQASFWSYMKLIPIGKHEFEVLSFPIRLSFDVSQDDKLLKVSGIYGWLLSGQTMKEVKH